MLKLKPQYFGHLMRRADSEAKTLMLGKIEGKRRRGQQRMRWLDGITDQCTWIWANSGSSEEQGSLGCSVTKSCPTVCHPVDCSTPSFPSLLPGVCPNSCLLSQWSHPTILSSAAPFSFCLQSFPAPRTFLVSQLVALGGQNIGASALASDYAVNIQSWLPLGLTVLILPSKGLSKVFSSTTIRKHQFFGTQLSLWVNSHICTWLLEQP